MGQQEQHGFWCCLSGFLQFPREVLSRDAHPDIADGGHLALTWTLPVIGGVSSPPKEALSCVCSLPLG